MPNRCTLHQKFRRASLYFTDGDRVTYGEQYARIYTYGNENVATKSRRLRVKALCKISTTDEEREERLRWSEFDRSRLRDPAFAKDSRNSTQLTGRSAAMRFLPGKLENLSETRRDLVRRQQETGTRQPTVEQQMCGWNTFVYVHVYPWIRSKSERERGRGRKREGVGKWERRRETERRREEHHPAYGERRTLAPEDAVARGG